MQVGHDADVVVRHGEIATLAVIIACAYDGQLRAVGHKTIQNKACYRKYINRSLLSCCYLQGWSFRSFSIEGVGASGVEHIEPTGSWLVGKSRDGVVLGNGPKLTEQQKAYSE